MELLKQLKDLKDLVTAILPKLDDVEAWVSAKEAEVNTVQKKLDKLQVQFNAEQGKANIILAKAVQESLQIKKEADEMLNKARAERNDYLKEMETAKQEYAALKQQSLWVESETAKLEVEKKEVAEKRAKLEAALQ